MMAAYGYYYVLSPLQQHLHPPEVAADATIKTGYMSHTGFDYTSKQILAIYIYIYLHIYCGCVNRITFY